MLVLLIIDLKGSHAFININDRTLVVKCVTMVT